jgi:hypothetical protein
MKTSRFGLGYTYFQKGSVPAVPEYLVDPVAFADLAAKMGLRIAQNMNFMRFEEFGDTSNLRKTMGASKPLEGESREIASLYRAIVLHKRKRTRE